MHNKGATILNLSHAAVYRYYACQTHPFKHEGQLSVTVYLVAIVNIYH